MKGNPYSIDCLEQMRKWVAGSGLPKVINFYSQRTTPTGIFSNFAPIPITIAGQRFPTSEHFFQAMKFWPHSPEDFRCAGFEARTAGDSAAVGRDRSRPLRSDWEKIKDDVMYDALCAKFLQDKNALAVLMHTLPCVLVEHTKNDRYWGDGGDGTGKNMLGKLLDKLKADIKNGVADDAMCVVFATEIREKGINPLRGNAQMMLAAAPGQGAPAAAGIGKRLGGTAADVDDDDQGKDAGDGAGAGGASGSAAAAAAASKAAQRRPRLQ